MLLDFFIYGGSNLIDLSVNAACLSDLKNLIPSSKQLEKEERCYPMINFLEAKSFSAFGYLRGMLYSFWKVEIKTFETFIICILFQIISIGFLLVLKVKLGDDFIVKNSRYQILILSLNLQSLTFFLLFFRIISILRKINDFMLIFSDQMQFIKLKVQGLVKNFDDYFSSTKTNKKVS